ncbi:MAG: M48 family metalloprotease [Bacteroidales bacterium]
MKAKILFLSVLVGLSGLFYSCDEDGGINLFSLEEDVQFGEQFHQELLNDPTTYPIVSEATAPEAYAHLRRIRDALLQSENLRYKEEFSWDVYLIKDDAVLNAFCVPGGKMYFYTGIIKYLDNESQFAGVMAHEMAHADKRHSTKMMTEQYGFSLLLSALLGDDPSLLASIAAELAQGLGSLKFSRDNEYEADEFAVKYTNDASGVNDYYPKGIADFFVKMGTQTTSLEFLSTHPDPGNRIEAINEVWESLSSPSGSTIDPSRYEAFKTSLPL